MKKFFYFLTGIFLFSVFTFTACKNFFNTTDLVDTLGNAISYANSPAFSVKIAPDNPKHGTVLSENIKDGVKVTDSFEVEFTVNDDFTFLGWDAVNKDDTSISYTDFVSFEDPHSLSTVATIIGGNDEIYKGQLQIRPACRAITKGTVAILSITGVSSISYNTTAEYKEGTKLDLRVTTQPQYQFTHWQVQIDGEIVNSTEFVSFENINNAETIATFKKRPDSGATVSIVPILAERPKVIIKNPDNPAGGAFKDTRINYVFNAAMDESSIYYSTEEKSKIDADSFLENDEVTWGYIKNNQIYFKNIEIRDVYNKLNLLEYFDKPFFSSEEQLVIPLKESETLPVGKTIIVNLSSAFISKTEDNFSISLNPDNSDLYFTVADKIDAAPPTIGVTLKAVGSIFYDRTYTIVSGTGVKNAKVERRTNAIWDDNSNLSEIVSVADTSSVSTVSTNDKAKYYAKNNTIYLDISVSDDGSGPASLEYEIIDKNNKHLSSKTLTNPGNGTPIRYNDSLQLTGSGLIYIQFIAKDLNGKTAKTDYYPVYLSSPDSLTALDSTKIHFTPQGAGPIITLDFTPDNLYYQYKNITDEIFSTPQKINYKTTSISTLTEATTYDFKLFVIDEFGNYNPFSAINTTASTKPVQPTLKTVTEDNGTINVTWDYPASGNYDGIQLYYSSKEDFSTSDSTQITKDNDTSYSFANFQAGNTWYYKLATYINKSELESEIPLSEFTTAKSVALPPNPVTDLKVTTTADTTILSFNPPENTKYDSFVVYYKEHGKTEWTKDTNDTLDKSKTPYTYTLQNSNFNTGKDYEFKVETISTATSGLTGDATISTKVPPKNISASWTKSTNNTIVLSWSKPANTTYDGIVFNYKKDGDTNFSDNIIVDSTQTSYTFTDLTPGTSYKIGYYTYSGNVNQTPTYADFYTVPNSVTNFSTSINGPDSLILTWNNPSGNYTGIVLSYKPSDSSSWTSLDPITSKARTHTIPGLDSGKQYDFKAVAYIYNNSPKYMSEEATVSAYTSVAPVGSLAVTSTTNTSVSLEWTKPSGSHTSVNVYYKKSSDDKYPTSPAETLPANTTSATIKDLSSGVTYSFKVETVNTIGTDSFKASKTIDQGTRPELVTNLTATRSATPSTTINLSWTNPPNLTNVAIFYATSNSTVAISGRYCPTAGKTTCSISSLNNGYQYYFWVVPYSGRSIPTIAEVNSNSSLSTPDISTITSVSERTSPSKPSGLTVASTTNNTVKLTWTKPSSPYSGYTIQKRDITTNSSASWEHVINTTATSLPYSVTSLEPGKKYEFRVRAFFNSTDNFSSWAENTVTVYTLPDVVTNLKVSRNAPTSGSTSNVTLSWTKPTTTYSGFAIYYGTTSTCSSFYQTTTSTSCNITGLSNDKTYYFNVVTYSGSRPSNLKTSTASGSSNYNSSGYCSIKTSPNPVTNLRATETTSTSVKVAWNNPTGSFTGVYLYKKDITQKETDYTSVGYIPSSTNYYNFSGLTAGHNYSFKITSYADSLNNLAYEATVEQYTRPTRATFNKIQATPQTTNAITLGWTYPSSFPTSSNTCGIHIYRNTTDDFSTATYIDYWYPSHSTKESSYSDLKAGTQYYFWAVTWVGTAPDKTPAAAQSSLNVASDSLTTSYTCCTSPLKNSTAPSIYMDDGQGRIKIKWTNASSNISGTDIWINDKYISYVSGTSTTSKWIDISNYKRGSSYNIQTRPYRSTSSNTSYADLSPALSYSNSTGNLVYYGTTYSYSSVVNALTSSKTVSQNTTDYAWDKDGNEVHRSVFYGTGSVTVSPYSMGKYEVTQSLFSAVMGTNPSSHTSNSYLPVENVTLYQAMLFCNKLSVAYGYPAYYKAKTSSSGSWLTDWTVTNTNMYSWGYNDTSDSRSFRLPTKTQWEFAARGGDPNIKNEWLAYYSGSYSTSSAKTYRERVAVCDTQHSSGPAEVYYRPSETYYNILNIYNMSGNVWEWTETLDNTNNNDDPMKKHYLQMGGSYDNNTRCAVDSSATCTPNDHDGKTGFRICRGSTCN